MKRISLILFVLVTSLTSYVATAQTTFPHHPAEEHEENHKGTFIAGGAINAWYDYNKKNTTIEIAPELGYLFTDKFGAGVLLGFGYEKENHNDHVHNHTTLKVSPFVRYYYLRLNPFNLYIDAGVGYNMIYKSGGRKSQIGHGFEVGIRPGACVDLTEGLCLCIRLGFTGFRKNYFSGEEAEITDNGFGLRFAPEEAMIGLELEI